MCNIFKIPDFLKIAFKGTIVRFRHRQIQTVMILCTTNDLPFFSVYLLETGLTTFRPNNKTLISLPKSKNVLSRFRQDKLNLFSQGRHF